MKTIPISVGLLSCTMLLAGCGTTGNGVTVGQTSSSSSQTTSIGLSSSHGTESKDTLEKKAEAGDKDAQFDLGALYHDGDGVAKDLILAKKWFEKAAAQGEAHAEFNLGVMYYTGEGVTKDLAKARTLFEQASNQGNARAQFNLGVLFYRGEGVKQDFAKAYALFTKSAMQNFGEAQFNLGVMEAKGEGKEPDIGKAYAWFTLARENGSPKAEEVLKNIERALQPDQLTAVKKITDELRKQVAGSAQNAKM